MQLLKYPRAWLNVPGLEGLQVSPCPVTGEYSGFIPKQMGLCARLASDPTHQEIMYFTVSDCEQQEVYEGTFTSSRLPQSLQFQISYRVGCKLQVKGDTQSVHSKTMFIHTYIEAQVYPNLFYRAACECRLHFKQVFQIL